MTLQILQDLYRRLEEFKVSHETLEAFWSSHLDMYVVNYSPHFLRNWKTSKTIGQGYLAQNLVYFQNSCADGEGGLYGEASA